MVGRMHKPRRAAPTSNADRDCAPLASGHFDTERYWQDRLSADDTLVGVGFSTLGQRYNRWIYRMRQDVFLDRVPRLGIDLEHADILEIGPGTGFYIDLWQRLGVGGITGVDIAPVAVERLAAHYPQHTFFQADIGAADAPVAAGAYDVVTAFDVLYHIVDEDAFEQALANVAKALRPGGLFLLADHFLHREQSNSRTAAHYVNRTLARYQDALERQGFEIVERRPMFVLMNAPPDSRSRLRRAWWLAVAGTASLAEPLGFAVGAILYPFERQLVRRRTESASTELMVCRRR
jgi:SAM-dependent methyltransferase